MSKTVNREKYQIDFDDQKAVISFINNMVKAMQGRYHPKYKGDIKELAWDCYVHFLTFQGRSGKNFFERYDDNLESHGTRTNPMYHLKIGIRNFLIDQERKSSRRVQTVSGDKLVGESTTLFQLVSEDLSEDRLEETKTEVLTDLVGFLKDERHWGPWGETSELGRYQLSYYGILYHYLKGYKSKEIAEFFGISVNRTNSIVREGVDILCTKYHARNYVREFVSV
jgi:DNA-directed RNA polymerase specialized sigma24 family protein